MCKSVTMAKELHQGIKLGRGKSSKQITDAQADYDQQRKFDAKSGIISSTTISGDCSPTILPMVDVQTSPLCKNHTFPDKNLLLLHIAEETNLRGIRTHMVKSNSMTLHVRGYKFVICANFSSSKGWHCSRVECREGDFIPSKDDLKFTDDDNEQYFDCEGADDVAW